MIDSQSPSYITVRATEPADDDAIAKLIGQCAALLAASIPGLPDDAELQRRWASSAAAPRTQVRAAFRDGELVGIASISRRGGCSWIDQIYVSPAQIGRGVGSKLLRKLLRASKAPFRLRTVLDDDAVAGTSANALLASTPVAEAL